MRFYTGVVFFGSEIMGIGGFPPDASHPGGFRYTGRQVKASSVQTVQLMRYAGSWWRVDYYGRDARGRTVYGLCGPATFETSDQRRDAGDNVPRDDYFAISPSVVMAFPWFDGVVYTLVDRAAMGYSGYMYQVGGGFWMLRDRADARPPWVEGQITAREDGQYCGIVDYELRIW